MLENARNPIAEALETSKWDGVDRLLSVYEIFGIAHRTAEDELSRTLFRKWFMQAIAMLYNGKDEHYYSPEFVLVLQGADEADSIYFFQHLVPRGYWRDCSFYKEKNINAVIQATSNWICDYEEIPSKVRKRVDSAERFLTKAIDEYREPYQKQINSHPRYTSFVRVVKSKKYLAENADDKLWATVTLSPTLRIDYNRIRSLDTWQLWCQIYAMMSQCGTPFCDCFRLTEKERKAVAERNSSHRKGT